MPRGMEPFVLLHVANAPAHGYEIAQAIGDIGFRRAAKDPSVVYKVLRTFEEEGLAVSAWDTADAGPPRRIYRITPKGLEHLAMHADDLDCQRARIDTFFERYRRLRSGRAPRGRQGAKRHG